MKISSREMFTNFCGKFGQWWTKSLAAGQILPYFESSLANKISSNTLSGIAISRHHFLFKGNDENYFDFEMKKGISQSGLEREFDHQPK